MIAAIQKFVRATDAAVARAYLAVRAERNALMPFLFHSLFRDEGEIARNVVEPLERTTVAQFREFVAYYLEHGYRFVSPEDLLATLDPARRYALITFDDGYYNNVLVRPILEEFKVPALFFISTNHVRQNKCYWWDVFYRERLAQGATRQQIYRETVALKHLRTEQIEAQLVDRFGANALAPRGDIDRPFAPEELREFAKCPYVHLGNHTADHAILTNYTPQQVREQITGAQQALMAMTGRTPVAIAYPNGAHDARIVEISRELGLKVGVTVRPHKTLLPLNSRACDLMRIGRFCPTGDAPMATQCRTYRSDLQLYGAFRAGYLRLMRGQIAQ